MKNRKVAVAHLNPNEAPADKWESGALGLDKKHARKVAPKEESAVEESLGLQMISIRLQTSLIEDLKKIATLEGLVGYQPLIRRVLTRFVDAEKKRILIERVNEAEAQARIKYAARVSARNAATRAKKVAYA